MHTACTHIASTNSSVLHTPALELGVSEAKAVPVDGIWILKPRRVSFKSKGSKSKAYQCGRSWSLNISKMEEQNRVKPNPTLVEGSGSWKKLSGGVKVATALRHGVKVYWMNIHVKRISTKSIMTMMLHLCYIYDVEGAIGEKGLLEETKGCRQCGFCFWEQEEGEEEGGATKKGACK